MLGAGSSRAHLRTGAPVFGPQPPSLRTAQEHWPGGPSLSHKPWLCRPMALHTAPGSTQKCELGPARAVPPRFCRVAQRAGDSRPLEASSPWAPRACETLLELALWTSHPAAAPTGDHCVCHLGPQGHGQALLAALHVLVRRRRQGLISSAARGTQSPLATAPIAFRFLGSPPPLHSLMPPTGLAQLRERGWESRWTQEGRLWGSLPGAKKESIGACLRV